MNAFNNWENIAEKEIVSGFFARMVHTDQLTFSRVRSPQGSRLPEHQHPHEQITHVLSGELEMVVNGESRICKAGDVVTIPGNTPHSAQVLADVELVDVFYPVREDYR
jgi:quercetin dioxygenase-like cupin family protein